MTNSKSLQELVDDVCTGFGQHDLTDRPDIFRQTTEAALKAPVGELEAAVWKLGNFLELERERITEGGVDRVYLARYHARAQGLLDLVEARLEAEQQAAKIELGSVEHAIYLKTQSPVRA